MQPSTRDGFRQLRVAAALVASAVALALAASYAPHSAATDATVGQRIGTISAAATDSGTAQSMPSTAPPAPTIANRRLVFDDEFDGDRLDSSVWMPALAWGNTNRDELEYYVPSALTQGGGVLSISASRRPTHGRDYSSGVIASYNSYAFKYGYVEARMQVPAGAGLWSAFWLLTRVHGPQDEVDVVEVLGVEPKQGYNVLHYGTEADKGRSIQQFTGADLSEGFHTYGVDWEADHVAWYVDGVEQYRQIQNVPTHPMYLIANLAVGGPGSWSGPPDDRTSFPAQLKIDYIRVYQSR